MAFNGFPTNSRATWHKCNRFKPWNTLDWNTRFNDFFFLFRYPSYLGAFVKPFDAAAMTMPAPTTWVGAYFSPAAEACNRNLSAIIWVIRTYNSYLYTSTQHCVRKHLVPTWQKDSPYYSGLTQTFLGLSMKC